MGQGWRAKVYRASGAIPRPDRAAPGWQSRFQQRVNPSAAACEIVEPEFSAGVALGARGRVAELLEQQHRQEPRPRPPARDDMKRRGWLADRLAPAAGKFLPHGLDHLPAAWDPSPHIGEPRRDPHADPARDRDHRANDRNVARTSSAVASAEIVKLR